MVRSIETINQRSNMTMIMRLSKTKVSKLILLTVLMMMFIVQGCVNSQIEEITTKYENGIKISEKIKRYPAPHAVKSIGFGLKIGFEVETKIPIVWFGILKREYIVGNDTFAPVIDENYKDINLLLGSGSATSYIGIEKINQK